MDQGPSLDETGRALVCIWEAKMGGNLLVDSIKPSPAFVQRLSVRCLLASAGSDSALVSRNGHAESVVIGRLY